MRCLRCNREFESTGPHQKYCSQLCGWRYRQKVRHLPGELKCQYCGCGFKPSRRWSAYCSPACRAKANWRVTGWRHRYDVPEIPKEFFATLFEQQHGNCAICGTLLDLAMSLDHIVPLDRGGATTTDNLQITCKECNHGKYTFSTEEYIEHC